MMGDVLLLLNMIMFIVMAGGALQAVYAREKVFAVLFSVVAIINLWAIFTALEAING